MIFSRRNCTCDISEPYRLWLGLVWRWCEIQRHGRIWWRGERPRRALKPSLWCLHSSLATEKNHQCSYFARSAPYVLGTTTWRTGSSTEMESGGWCVRTARGEMTPQEWPGSNGEGTEIRWALIRCEDGQDLGNCWIGEKRGSTKWRTTPHSWP